MKKIFILLSLFTAGLMQAQAEALKDSTVTYDINGNYASKVEYQYDSLGRNTATISYVWESGVKVGKDYTQTTFDNLDRKSQETVYKWDKVAGAYNPYARYNHEYQGDTQTEIRLVTQMYDEDNEDWAYTSMVEHDYDAAGRNTRFEHFIPGDLDWETSYRQTWAFDAKGNTILEQVDSLMAGQTELVIFSQTRNEYNIANKPTLALVLKWNANTQATDSNKLTTYEYDGSNNQTLLLVKTYTNNVWTGGNKTIQVYENNRLVLKEYYKSYSKGVWTGGNKTLYNYDAAGNQTFYEYYGSWTDGVWNGSTKYDKEYNASKRVTLQIDYKWNKTTVGWDYSKKTVTNYDGTSARKTESAVYTWNGSSWGKSGDTRTTTVYNTSGSATEVINYTWGTSDWVYSKKTETIYDGSITITMIYNWKSDAWVGYSYSSVEKSGGNTICKIVKIWKNNVWVNSTKDTTVYYSGSKVLDNKTFNWDDSVSVWVNNTWTANEYNKSGINVFSLTKQWNDSVWVILKGSKNEKDYNAAGKETRNEDFTCGSDSIWKGKTKTITMYDEANRDTLEQEFKGVNGEYQNSYKITKAYDQWGHKILDKKLYWVTDMWQGKGKDFKEWAYNSKKMTMEATYIWNSDRFDWDGLEKYGYEYAADEVTKLYDVKYYWDYKKNIWYIKNKNTEVRDEQNRIIEKQEFPYDTVTSQYVNGTREEYAYRNDETVKANTYKWYNEQWNRFVQSETHYDEDADAKLRYTVNGSWTAVGVLNSFDSVYYFYNTDPKLRTIIFKNWNDTVLEQQQLVDGETPVYGGAEPSKTATAAYTYQFKEWTPAIVAVSANAVYTATFDSTAIKYEVRFVNGETTLQTDSLAYGVMPEYKGSTPEKAATAQYTYTFKAWEPEVVAVTADAVYTATFDSTAVLYQVVFISEGDTLQNEMLEYGAMPEYKGETPTKEPTVGYTYEFKGWTPDIVDVTEDATYTAEFTATPVVPTATEQVYEFDPTQTFYNLQGQIVDETYRGIVIQNGHRYILQ